MNEEERLAKMADLMAEAARDDDLLLRVWFHKFKMSDAKTKDNMA